VNSRATDFLIFRLTESRARHGPAAPKLYQYLKFGPLDRRSQLSIPRAMLGGKQGIWVMWNCIECLATKAAMVVKVGPVEVDTGSPYLDIFGAVFVVLAIALGMSLIKRR
jgi:hypothetical protein